MLFMVLFSRSQELSLWRSLPSRPSQANPHGPWVVILSGFESEQVPFALALNTLAT
jgi:hypothetical protein